MKEPDTDRQILHGIIYVWNLKRKVKLIETESKKVFSKAGG